MTAVAAEPRAVANPRPSHRENNFDALRLIFAIFVLVGHSYGMAGHRLGYAYFDVGGRLRGVDVGLLAHVGLIGFFSISGYLVTESYLRSPTLLVFVWKRLLRIWPAFLAAAAFSILVAGPLGSDDPAQYLRDLDVAAQARAIAALHVCMATAHAFPLSSPGVLNGPTWSLPVEFLAYLFVAGAGVCGLLRRRWPVALAWAACAALFAAIVARPRIGNILVVDHAAINDMAPVYHAFLGGMLIRLYPIFRRPAVVASLVALWLAGHRVGAGYLVMGIVAPALVVWAGEHRVRLPRLRDDLSYGIYLTAWPIQNLLLGAFHLNAGPLALFTIPLAAGLALFSWRFIERPALALKAVDPVATLRRIPQPV